MILLIWGTQHRQIHRNRKNRCHQGLGDKGMEMLFNGNRVSLGGDEKVQAVDGSDRHTILYTHLMPLNCTLRNDSNGKFYVMYILAP